jgi:PTH1 family peptidyl-tRNA hydrolase
VIRVYAFLGNHGREHARNRHNVAWLFLESLPFYADLRWERKFKGSFAVHETPAGRTWILRPETYMNLSGDSVAELLRFFQLAPSDLLAVHDELEIPFGSFGFKMGGGLGGHNGLRSLEARLGTRDFARLRLGIGRPDHPDVAGYVLSDFSAPERESLACAVFPKAAEAFLACLADGFDEALARFPKVKALE